MTTPQIMAFIQTGAVGAPDEAPVFYDWIRNQLYMITSGSASNSGIHQFDGYATGNETLNKTIAQLGLPSLFANGACLTRSGYLEGNEFISNSTTLWEVYGPTGALVNQFGIASSSLAPSTNTRILTPGSQACIRYGSTDFIMSCPLVSGFGEICVLTVPGLLNVNLGALTENTGFCGPGSVGASTGTGFVLGVGGVTNLGLYEVTVSLAGSSMARVGSITPAAVDATWSSFTAASGCAYDQTDGNVLIYVHSSGHTNTDYLVKLNAATAAVMWATPINGSINSVDMAQWQITRQIVYYMGTSNTLYTFNTSTGAATTQIVGNLIATSCVSEDIYGSFIGYGTWSEVSTHPTYVGTYMGPPGNNHTFTNTWFRYMPNGAISPPTPPALPEPGVVSNVQAWTYVQDGHTFYVLDLGTQGTFAFDTKTSQWCQMQTNGGNWAMVNGIMWGQRVVAGDPASTDVWELDPAATKDSGGLYDIAHVVTGGISTRARTYISCDAVRISASFGQLDETGNVTFNLRWSDDQGQNWSAYYPVTMTAGNFDAEIAWRSLGSFNAPGRIFEFSDSGGLVRIDGCDAFLNGFDNDQQSQENEQS